MLRSIKRNMAKQHHRQSLFHLLFHEFVLMFGNIIVYIVNSHEIHTINHLGIKHKIVGKNLLHRCIALLFVSLVFFCLAHILRILMIARRCYDIIAHYVRRSAIKVSFGRKVYKIARMYEHHVVLLGIFHRLVKIVFCIRENAAACGGKFHFTFVVAIVNHGKMSVGYVKSRKSFLTIQLYGYILYVQRRNRTRTFTLVKSSKHFAGHERRNRHSRTEFQKISTFHYFQVM